MKKLLLTALLPAVIWSGMAHSALTLNADRIVYNEKDGDASVTVHSDEDRAYLIQSWLDSGDSTAKQNLPFVVTPPLFRLAPKSDNLIRVMYLGHGLPTDKETLLWLDVKGVPGLKDEEAKVQNRMVLAINNRVKFFFRPTGLKGEPGEAIKNAHWARSGNTVTVENNSPYHLVLSKIDIDKELIKVSVTDNNTVIPPFGKKSYTLHHTPRSDASVQWEAINDFGGTTKTYTQRLD